MTREELIRENEKLKEEIADLKKVSGQYLTSCNEKSQSHIDWLFTIGKQCEEKITVRHNCELL